MAESRWGKSVYKCGCDGMTTLATSATAKRVWFDSDSMWVVLAALAQGE